MKSRNAKKGFSIVELMIVVVIVAILVALAVPSYQRYVRKANRTEAQQLMLQYAQNQEIWRANDSDYADSTELPLPGHDRYDFTIRENDSNCGTNADPSNIEYFITACAKSGTDQTKDVEGITPCTDLTLNQANEKLPVVCW